MTKTTADRPSRTGQLVLQRRTQQGLTRAQLSKRASVSESTISAIEHARRIPSMAVCARLMRALNLGARELIDARALDELHDDPRAQTTLEHELAAAAWSESAKNRLRVVHGDVRLDVDEAGTLAIERSYRGCTTVRPRTELVFRDRVVGKHPSVIEIQRAPIGYDAVSKTQGSWCEHRIQFHEPWTKGSIDLVFRVTLPEAYVLGDLDEFNRRQKVAGLPQLENSRGVYQFYLTYAFENLTLSMNFPRSYDAKWSAPVATSDRATFDDGDHLTLDDISLESSFSSGRQAAKLKLKQPMPSNSILLTWNDPA